jgi:hypothetical protein
MPRLDLAEMRFGKLVAQHSLPITKRNYIQWFCICDCGRTSEVRSSHLKSGAIKSCGCEAVCETTHGFARSKNKTEFNFFQVWQGIRTRCYNANSFPYKDYGGRGIAMSDEWRDSFENFKNDMYESYKPGLTIERKDVNGNYCKENCIWIPRSLQGRNRRPSIWIETELGRMTINEAAKIVGISWLGMYQRVRQKWPKEKLLIAKNMKQRIMPKTKHNFLLTKPPKVVL